jgi:hypothetical protein
MTTGAGGYAITASGGATQVLGASIPSTVPGQR